VRFLIAASLLAGLSAVSWAAESGQKDYDPHHPEDAASAPKVKTPTAKPAASKSSVAKPSTATKQNLDRMDRQMMMMGEMHQKMMSAKTTEERSALMGERMQVMQDSMSMMNMMGGSGMGDTTGAGGKGGPGMGGMQGGKGTAGSMEDRQQMMEKRMDMMQMMMQMMMDAEPAAAAK